MPGGDCQCDATARDRCSSDHACCTRRCVHRPKRSKRNLLRMQNWISSRPAELASHTGPSSALSVHAYTKDAWSLLPPPSRDLVPPPSEHPTLELTHFVTPLPTLFVVPPAPKWQEVAQPHAWLSWSASTPSPTRLPHRSRPRRRTVRSQWRLLALARRGPTRRSSTQVARMATGVALRR